MATNHQRVTEGLQLLTGVLAPYVTGEVARGTAEVEYQDPVEFFARTYLTEGMRGLLVAALRRIAGNGGEPVIQLKTAFGGGKTHSLLALSHLLRDRIAPDRLANVTSLQDPWRGRSACRFFRCCPDLRAGTHRSRARQPQHRAGGHHSRVRHRGGRRSGSGDPRTDRAHLRAHGGDLEARRLRGGLRGRPPSALPAPRRRSRARRRVSGVQRPLPRQRGRLPARVPRGPPSRAPQGVPSYPPRTLRPAVRGLVHAGAVSAHPRRPAPDGRRDRTGVASGDYFGFATSISGDGRYEGLALGGAAAIYLDAAGMLVKPDAARAQLEVPEPPPGSCEEEKSPYEPSNGPEPKSPQPKPSRRFFGMTTIDPDRAGRDMGDLAEEVLQHLTTLPGAKVRVTVEIEAEFPEGVPPDTQRTVDENCRTLGFEAHGFEERQARGAYGHRPRPRYQPQSDPCKQLGRRVSRRYRRHRLAGALAPSAGHWPQARGETPVRARRRSSGRTRHRRRGGVVIFGDANAEPVLGATALQSVGVEIDLIHQRVLRRPSVRLKAVQQPRDAGA